uniref:Uncharacterized protein n=1 Tax=Alexandrium andersonii TaxID=327968 RepID=A0A7S2FM68_9DINO
MAQVASGRQAARCPHIAARHLRAAAMAAPGGNADPDRGAGGSGEDSAEQQPSIWEVLDELIGMDRASLTRALGVVLSILLLIGGFLVYREVSLGRTQLALLYGGFLLLVFGLIGSIAFVLAETTRLEANAPQATSSEDKANGRGVGLREKAE